MFATFHPGQAVLAHGLHGTVAYATRTHVHVYTSRGLHAYDARHVRDADHCGHEAGERTGAQGRSDVRASQRTSGDQMTRLACNASPTCVPRRAPAPLRLVA